MADLVDLNELLYFASPGWSSIETLDRQPAVTSQRFSKRWDHSSVSHFDSTVHVSKADRLHTIKR